MRVLLSYTGAPIQPKGYIVVPVTYKGLTKEIEMYVIENGGPPLLGRNFYNAFELSIHSIIEKAEVRNRLAMLIKLAKMMLLLKHYVKNI